MNAIERAHLPKPQRDAYDEGRRDGLNAVESRGDDQAFLDRTMCTFASGLAGNPDYDMTYEALVECGYAFAEAALAERNRRRDERAEEPKS